MPNPRLTRISAALAAAVLVLGACSSGGSGAEVNEERDPSTDVPFTGCDVVACEGELEGAAYQILMPETWNGSLLLYSHGYRTASPAPPDYAPVSTAAEPAPGFSRGDTRIADALLADGYALAGSAYASNGLSAVEDGVAAGEQLHAFFVGNVADPNRTYLWGDSLGGLITQLLAERNPDWVNGAAPLCGAVAGLVPNLDLALDVGYGIQQLIDPDFQPVGFESVEQANAQWESIAPKIVAAAADVDGGGTAAVVALGALVDAQTRTARFDGSTLDSQVKALVESLLTAVGVGTYGRFDVEQHFGGNVSDNVDTDYAARFGPAELALIEAAGGDPEQIIEALQTGERIAADPAARERARSSGIAPTGAIRDETITLHTAADPLVIAQNESWLAAAYRGNPDRAADLVQLFTVAPAEYSEQDGAPYGAGHCNFTPESRLGVIELLDGWVREGIYPSAARVQEVFGPGSGFDPMYKPPAWPDPDAQE